jgi:hypothetical protein
MPAYSILYSAAVSGTAGTGLVGDVLIPDSTTGAYVKATAANRGTRRSTGLALSAYEGGQAVEIQQHGRVRADVAGLGAGTESWVRVSSAGRLERATVSGDDDVCGRVETDGTFTAMFGVITASLANGGGGSGSVDINAGISEVRGIRGRAVSATAPLLGQRYIFDGTEHVPAGRKMHVSLFGGVADSDLIGGGTCAADAIEAAIESLDVAANQSGVIEFDATPGTAYKLARTVNIRQACILRGQGSGLFAAGTMFLAEPGVTPFRVLGSDDPILSPSGAYGTVIEDIRIQARGQDLTLTTGDYDGQSSKAVSGATNATPIVVTTSNDHAAVTGDTVIISGVVGNTAANGTWTIIRLSGTTMSLTGSVGNGAYVSGGVLENSHLLFRVLNVADTSDFTVGQIISVDGMGQPCTLRGVTASTTSGSPTVTFSTATSDRLMLAMGDNGGGAGVPVGLLRAGWYLTIPGAYTYPVRVASTDLAGTTLTMASNASGNTTDVEVRWRSPMIGMIVSKTADSITIDSYGASLCEASTALIMTASLSREVTIRHFDCGIDVRNKAKINRVSVGGPLKTNGFLGAAFAFRGDHGNIPQSTGVNMASVQNSESYHNRHCGYAVGSDANGVAYSSVQSSRSWDWSFVDISTLGNFYAMTHTDGSHGIVTHDPVGCESVILYPYTEAGTVNSFGPGCIILGQASGIYSGGTCLTRGIMNQLQTGVGAIMGTELYHGEINRFFRAKSEDADGSTSFGIVDANSDAGVPGWLRFSHELVYRNHPLMISDDDQSDVRAGTLRFPHDFMLGDDPYFNALTIGESARIASTRGTAETGAVNRDPAQGTFDAANANYLYGALNAATSTDNDPSWDKGDLIRDANVLDGQALHAVIEDGHRAPEWQANTSYAQYNIVCPTRGNHNGRIYQKLTAGSQTSHAATEPTWTAAPNLQDVTAADGTIAEWTNVGAAAFTVPVDPGGHLEYEEVGSETWTQTSRPFLHDRIKINDTDVSLGGALTITLPVNRRTFAFWNNTAQNVLIKCATGNTVTIAAGKLARVFGTGVEMRRETDDVTP